MNPKGNDIPIIAITMGDPAGIGPEIAVKTFANKDLYSRCKPLLIGHLPTIQNTVENLGLRLDINPLNELSTAQFRNGGIDLYKVDSSFHDEIAPGQLSRKAGDLAFKSITTAIDLALKKEVDATVTGPIHKEAINNAGHHFSGHTEIYAYYTNTPKYAMLLADENIKVIHATTHVSLREACDLIKRERILEVIYLLDDGLKKLGYSHPEIGVAGLNPHSGDGGLFGDEEKKEIHPAVEQALKEGYKVEGPVPADTLFALAKGGKYDGVVAMYHDQGHIPFKLLGFEWDNKNKRMKSVKGVNITLGLPIIRTSVDHGTAFEIAGKGIASPDALNHAISYAIKLVNY